MDKLDDLVRSIKEANTRAQTASREMGRNFKEARDALSDIDYEKMLRATPVTPALALVHILYAEDRIDEDEFMTLWCHFYGIDWVLTNEDGSTRDDVDS